MTDLLSCPFCGGEAHPINDRHNWWVACRKCGMLLGFKGEDQWGAYGTYSTEAEAIEAWNTRQEQTCRDIAPEGADWLMCSECGKGTHKVYEYRYCPNCGARVEESDPLRSRFSDSAVRIETEPRHNGDCNTEEE